MITPIQNGALCPLCGSRGKHRLVLRHTTVWQCPSTICGLQFAHPQPDEESLEQAYTAIYYPRSRNGREGNMEATPVAVLRQVFAQLEKRLGSLRELRLLDYGCGIGPLIRVARDFGLDATGVEPNPEAREAAAAICPGGVYKDFEALRTARSGVQFDLITLWNVIEHLRRPWVDLQELRRLLAPRGSLLVSTMNVRCLRAQAERERWENYWNPTHFYYFDRKSLERVIAFSGFRYATEWKPTIRFPHHGLVRRALHAASTRLGVADGLYYMCP